MVFYHNASSTKNVCMKSANQPTMVHVAKQDRFSQKGVLCVLWNFGRIINYFKLIQNGSLNAAAPYSEQLDDRVCTALAGRRYPEALTSRKHALLQQDNAAIALEHCCYHHCKNQLAATEVEFLFHPTYSPDFARPYDYCPFPSMSHFLPSAQVLRFFKSRH